MQISHAEAKKLIQYSLDHSLSTDEKNTLDIHFDTCRECRSFTNEMSNLENSLKLLSTQFASISYTPLDTDAFLRKANLKMIWLSQLATISLVFVLFLIGAWQFSHMDLSPMIDPTYQVSPIPTPSPFTTSAFLVMQDCQNTTYIIQTGDTIESIASQFNISHELLINENSLLTSELQVGTELMIPICSVTPSLTINPPTLTSTFSPTMSLTAYIP